MIAALVLAAVTGVLPVAAVPAAATPMASGPCSGATGVTVVVDFGRLGDTVVRCAAGDPASASAALERAGFDQTRVQRQPAFLCRIDGLPTPAEDACVVTPPATAYWALWSASRGGSWTFANVGVDLLDPKPGTVIGFAFGDGARPRIAAPAPAPAPRPSSPGPATGASTAASVTAPSAGTQAAPGAAAPTGAATSPASRPGTHATSEPTSPAATTSASSPPATAAPAPSAPASLAATPTASRTEEPGGGSVGAWVGAGAIVAIGTAALVRARLRRRR